MRLGGISRSLTAQIGGRPNVWVHAVSVGEVLAVLDLIQKIKARFPDYQIVCSTVTKTGQKLAKEKLSKEDIVIYAPLDFSWVVRKFIRVIQPKIYVTAETEIWPNLYALLHKANVPIVLVNGRISDKSFEGYRKFRFLTRRVLACVDFFCMQSEQDVERIKHLGAPSDKVKCVGNIKFDNLKEDPGLDLSELKLHIPGRLFVAGSTHPGEEEIICDAYAKLKSEFAGLRLVMAPRHIERTDEVMKIIKRKRFHPVRLSDVRVTAINENTVVVVDTIGYLRHLYKIATVVFIGKTLNVNAGGGQNMIEPVAFGKPTLVGPHTQNFKNVVSIFLKAKCLIQVNDPEELLTEMKKLLNSSERMAAMGQIGMRVIEQNEGATDKSMDIIGKFL